MNLREDDDWQAQIQRDEAWKRHEVEEAFRRLYRPYLGSRVEQDWELLAQALDHEFPGFLKFYRSL